MEKKQQNNKDVDLLKAYQQTFNSPQGRMVLQDMMINHFVLTSAFDPDPYILAEREGERNTVLRILTYLDVDPSKLLEQIEERRQHAR